MLSRHHSRGLVYRGLIRKRRRRRSRSGPNGVYVGTVAGRVIAYAPCTSYGSLGHRDAPELECRSLVVRRQCVRRLPCMPETAADPVYVALCEGGRGRLVALSLTGRMLWTTAPERRSHVPSATSRSIESRTRHVAEADGTIRVLSDRGEALLVEEALAGLGKTVRSKVAWILVSRDGRVIEVERAVLRRNERRKPLRR